MRKLLFLAVVSNFSTYFGQAQTCTRGPHNLPRFGPLCEYLCHCGGYQCNRESGECPQNVECDDGWMGSGCQYANIAYGATVSSNHLFNVQTIVDGNGATCPSLNQQSIDSAYVTVDIGREVKITAIHLVFSDRASVQPFRISVGINDTWSVCNSVSDVNGIQNFVVKCDSPLYGRYINITSEGRDAKLQVCEIKFPTGRNVAYGKPAYQSTLFETYYPSQAVDGDTRSTPPSGTTCTHTLETRDPWWILDLQSPIRIMWFRLFNRADDSTYNLLNERMRNFRISLSQDNITFKEYYQDKSQDTPLVINPVLNPEVIARFVKIDLQGDRRILTLCEVQVFGNCDDGSYGNCTQKCDYCPGELCDKLTGYCQECQLGYFGNTCNESCDYCYQGDCSHDTGKCRTCPPGKQGDYCEYDCMDFYFGMNCSSRCGNCLNGEVCHKVTGNCQRGCQDGWQKDKCMRECDDLFYGNCSTSCGKCAAGRPCNKSSGLCDNGACMDGWQTKKCDIPCDDHYYGNCSTECGRCQHHTVCDKVNGSCPSGLCSEGWHRQKCDTVCESTHYGQNCELPCGKCLNETCDSITGNCSGNASCQPGWQGPRCDVSSVEIQRPESGVDVGIVAGSVGAVVAIAGFIVAIIIFIIIRRRKQKQNSWKMSSLPSSSSMNNDTFVYENSTFVRNDDSTLEINVTRNKVNVDKYKPISKQETTVAIDDTEIYYNVGSALPKGTISLSKFWDYVQEKFLDENYFSEEFDNLPSGLQLPTTVALRPENRKKNRYKQLYAYDVNRVVLEPLADDDNDYINASFVDGFSHPKMYIASQGTTKDNINDFWRMLWQDGVEKIVMLTGLVEGGKHKCELYWPVVEGRASRFGSVTVKLLDTDSYADYEIRTLEMSVNKQSKQLTHFHYTAWPDKGVPETASSIIQFWNKVNAIPTKQAIVVHCSAGIGRTGTYIALDYLVCQGKVEGHVNVSACVSNLRLQRVNMVQTKEQYCFLHEALAEALLLSGTATASNYFHNIYKELQEVDGNSGKLKLQLEYERLQTEVINHDAVYAVITMEDDEEGEVNLTKNGYSTARKPENKDKMRDNSVLPADRHRIYLSTRVSDRKDYINAVVLPSHKQRNAFILTHMPLPDTVIDIWRMINDFGARTIIMLNSMDSKTHDIGIYWPTDGEVRYGPFCVRLMKTEKSKNYTERILSFSVTGDETIRLVKQFQFTNWSVNSDVPGSVEAFLDLLDAVETWQKESEAKPVVVHCLNGAHRSGLYCVISSTIERLNLEKDVAIVQTIKRMRAIRQQIIPSYEQFWFCHECILQYISKSETYYNF
ncbi:hypothetical protein ACJMK2_032091 [Sinanodonta woodiana]|uniref:protein-tyrosine-phosphatase n=1 Tax=Sinanodonta woodiana TaxID=1069815 RepID=A0ABD3X0P9_SINWO